MKARQVIRGGLWLVVVILVEILQATEGCSADFNGLDEPVDAGCVPACEWVLRPMSPGPDHQYDVVPACCTPVQLGTPTQLAFEGFCYLPDAGVCR